MAPYALKRMTPEEFYRWPGEEGVRYELVDGVPFRARIGVSRRHDHIVVNLLSGLHAKLRDRPCQVATKNVAIATAKGNLRRPDASVDCGQPVDTAFEATSPRLVAEVLPASMPVSDFLLKLEDYKAIASLAYILLVETGVPRAQLLRRTPGSPWELAQFDGLDGVIDLGAIGTQLAMAELYEDVTFPDPLAGEGGLR